MSTLEFMHKARQFHQAGRLQEAETLYRQVLAQEPRNADALHLLGVIAYQTGHLQHAFDLIHQATQLHPAAHVYHNSLGEVCRAMKRWEQAIACYGRAVALWPAYAEAYANLGNAYHEMGRLDDAIAAYREAVRLNPNLAAVHRNLGYACRARGLAAEALTAFQDAVRLMPGLAPLLAVPGTGHADAARPPDGARPPSRWAGLADAQTNIGHALREMGRLDEAVAAYRKAVEIAPQTAETHYNLANALREQGDPARAVAAYREAIRLRPDFVNAHNNLGAALQLTGRQEEAVAAFREAVRLQEQWPEAWNNLGNALGAVGRLDEAAEAHRRAIGLRPDYAPAYNSLGNTLRDQDRLDEAEDLLRKAVELDPALPAAHYNLANVLRDKGRFQEALQRYDEAVRRRPDDADARWNRALLLLLMGDYVRGWAEYEWRWKVRKPTAIRPGFPQPEWTGDDPAGRTILVYAEQGFGDTLQFVRYVPLLAERGARVVLLCQPELKTLAQSVRGAQQVLAFGETPPPFDAQTALLSLPLVFGTTVETIPRRTPYLKPDAARALNGTRSGRVEKWREKTASAGEGFRVGLAWAGNPANREDVHRSVPLSALAPLAQAEGVLFFSLQKGAAAEQAQNAPPEMRLVDLTGQIADFADTAALIANLDLVITVETAVAHLAGAMGAPTWTLLPFVPAWRWLLDREDSPWYPTMRLFRQQARGEWADVMTRVARELRDAASGYNATA